MKLANKTLIGVLILCFQSTVFAQVNRNVLYSDLYLKQFVNVTLQRSLQEILIPSINSTPVGIKTINTIKSCYSQVVKSKDYLTLSTNKMKAAAIEDDDKNVQNTVRYLHSPRGQLYLIVNNPLLSGEQIKNGIKKIRFDTTKEPDGITQQERESLMSVANLIAKIQNDQDIQAGFLKIVECKKYDLNKLTRGTNR